MNKKRFTNDRYHWYREEYPGPYPKAQTGLDQPDIQTQAGEKKSTELQPEVAERGLCVPREGKTEQTPQRNEEEENEDESDLDDSLLLPDSDDCSLDDFELDDTLIEDDEEELGHCQT